MDRHEGAIAAHPFFARPGAPRVERIERLTGGLQNANFKVTTADGGCLVVRIPAPDAAAHGQDQHTVHANAVATAAVGIAPRPVGFDAASGIIVTEWVEGTTLSPAAVKADPELLAQFVGAVRKLHLAAVPLTSSRASDVISGYPIEAMAALLPSGVVPPRAVELQALLRRCLGAFEPVVGCHNDLTPANCMVRQADGAVLLVDWEWSGPFDVMHDIAKLVLLSELNDAEGEARVLRLYYGAEAVTPLHHARIRLWLLHTVSREALWCHAAASNPADDDFDYAGEAKRFAREFADRLATEETALLMAEVEAALAAR